jgi:chromosome segregation ATPase
MLKKETDLKNANEKFAHVQADLVKTVNEKLAVEKKLRAELKSKEEALEEKEEELEFLKGQQGDGIVSGREEDLLRRIDEDEAKITALERLLGDDRELKSAKEALKKTEQKLQAEIKKAAESNARHVELVQEREDALDQLEKAHDHIDTLNQHIREREARIHVLQENEGSDFFWFFLLELQLIPF